MVGVALVCSSIGRPSEASQRCSIAAGTFINDERVEKGSEVDLQHGDQIMIGAAAICYKLVVQESVSEDAPGNPKL